MPDTKEISALTTAESTSASDLFETALPNAMTETGYVSRKVTLGTIANFILGTLQFSSLNTTVKNIIGAINEVLSSAGGGTVLTATLTAGQTTVTFTDNALVSTCKKKVYVPDDFFGVAPTAITTDYANHTVTYTFPVQASNMQVKLEVT
jgi:hypothetical protein